MTKVKTYAPGGPVMKRFHESSALVRAVAGPIGSSKTTGAGPAEMMLGACVQRPQEDGVRRFLGAVLRDTYRNLYATTMKTWFEWIPRELGHFVGSDDRPAIHTFAMDTPVGPLELDIEFRALGSNSVEAVCRGWERNGAYLDEADLMPPEAPTYLIGRVMRGGDKRFRVTKGVWLTFNKPDVDHHLYGWCMEGGFDGDFEFFDQPSGLLPGLPYRTNPAAENLANLDDGYYVKSAQGQPGWYVQRMIRNEWGASISGERIYPQFTREMHVLPAEIDPPPGSVLRLGLDGGGTPAAVIGGRDAFGRRVIFAEIVITDPYDPKRRKLATGVGANRFAQEIRDVIAEPRFRGCRFEIGFGDPAAFYGADREAGEYSFMETVGLKLGIPVIPSESNEIGLRLDAVNGLLSQLAEDGRPMLMINPSCQFLIRGFTADYKWEEVDPKKPGARLKPQKTATSHAHDGLQYYCLGDVGRVGVTAGRAFDRHNPKLPTFAVPGGGPSSSLETRAGMKGVVRGTHYEVKFNPWA